MDTRITVHAKQKAQTMNVIHKRRYARWYPGQVPHEHARWHVANHSPCQCLVHQKILYCNTQHNGKKWDTQIEVFVTETIQANQAQLDKGVGSGMILGFICVASIRCHASKSIIAAMRISRELTGIHCKGSIPWVAYE